MYLGSFMCGGFYFIFFHLLVSAWLKDGGHQAPTNNQSLYHHHVSIHPEYFALSLSRMDWNPFLCKKKETFPTTSHPICFGEISAKIVTIEWQRILFWIKPFNAYLVFFKHRLKVTAHCNRLFRGLQRKSKPCPGLFVLLQVVGDNM